jgi:hypothetical protein
LREQFGVKSGRRTDVPTLVVSFASFVQMDIINTAIVAGLFGLLGTILGGVLNLRVERKKQEGNLILEALKTGNTTTAARNILFFSEAGLIRLSQKQVKALEEARGSSILPVLPQSGLLEKFTAVPSTALTPELNAIYVTVLRLFQSYLRRSGFTIKEGGEIKFDVVPGDVVSIDNLSFYSVYDPGENTMHVASKYAVDTDLILHEYMRHVLSRGDEGAPSASEDARWWEYYAIQSGLAVYYPCSFDERPVFGRTKEISTNLDNETKFAGAPLDQQSANTDGATVWGGAFWESRRLLGQAESDKLLASAWISWHPSDPSNVRSDFVKRMVELQESGEHSQEIKGIFERRGIKL